MNVWRRAIDRLKANPFQADVGLALLLAVVSLPALASNPHTTINFRDPDVFAVALTLGSSLPLAWRRQRPLAVLLVVGVPAVLYEALGYRPGNAGGIGVVIALYTVAAHCDRRTSVVAALYTTAGLVIILLTARWDAGLGDGVSQFAVFGTAFILGDNLRTRRAHTASLEERATLAEQGRLEDAARAVSAERTRIARELHDVVAHSVSVMVVQAGAARRILDHDPEQAKESMASIEAVGRQSLTEMRRLLGVLRKEDDRSFGRAPQPSMASVDALVAKTREAGLPVDLATEGTARDLAPGVDLTAYRIVQEALTNAIKHAGPRARAVVRLRYQDDGLELEVSDDGRGRPPADGVPSSGHGLVGMQERVTLFGGSLHLGDRPGGGFVVRARLPYEGAAEPERAAQR